MKNEGKLSLGSTNQIIDPFQASLDSLLAVSFPKTNSKNYPFAVRIAESAERYGIATIDGRTMHFAVFGMTQGDAGRASALFGYIRGWKGVLIFVKGKMIRDSYRLEEVLKCFLDSTMCDDTRAHCHSIVDNSFQGDFVGEEKYVFPCKHLLPWFRLQRNHPSSIQDQIQAAGVKHGCNVCPNFAPDMFRKVETRPRK